PHPAVQRRLLMVAHVNDAAGGRELINEEDVVLPLHDLERIGHVVGARNPRHIALRFGIALWPAGPVFVALLQRRRLVRNRSALDDAGAWRDRADRAELPERGRLCRMVLEIPELRANRLVDAVEIRVA